MRGAALTWLGFGVGRLALALPAADVTRVWPAMSYQALPGAPAVVAGLADLGGRAVPVLDLRTRLGLPATALHPGMVLIEAATRRRQLLLLADRVDGVRELAPAYPVPVAAHGLAGVASSPDGLLLICDLARLLSTEEERHLASRLAETER